LVSFISNLLKSSSASLGSLQRPPAGLRPLVEDYCCKAMVT